MRAVVVAVVLCAAALMACGGVDGAAVGRKGRQSQGTGALIAIDAALGQYSVQVAAPPACAGAGPKGVCIDIDNFTCDNGQLMRGRCKGDNSMLCCTGTPAEKDGAVAATIPTTPFPVTPPPPQPPIPDRAVAFKATLTPAGVAALNRLVNSVLQKQLAKPLVIPDQTLSIPTPQLGTFGMTVRNLIVSNAAVGPVALALVPPASVSASVTGGNAQAEADFAWTRTTFPRVGGSGHLQVTVADLSVSFALSVTAVNSKLAIAMTSSKVLFDRLNFRFSQSWDSFVLNAITSLFMAQLKPLIQTQVAAALIPQFNAQISAILNGMPATTTFPAAEMTCTLRFGFETVQAGADGLTLGESFAVDCD